VQVQPAKISRQSYELPLLKGLLDLGGSSAPDDKLYGIVATYLGLDTVAPEYDPVHARAKWVYELQWVRHTLVKRGELDGTQRGLWSITEKGRERVRDEWGAYTPPGLHIDSSSDADDATEERNSEEAQRDALSSFAQRYLPESLDAVKGQLILDDTPIHQIVTIVNASRHLIITGPPGTGKTTLAINACEQAVATNFVSGYSVTTATSDWTTFDTIGGYMPGPSGQLLFHPGVVLRSIADNNWLVIDEINRADVDKAFGPLLTVLSGQDLVLPYTSAEGIPIKIRRANGLESYHDAPGTTYFVGDNWRVIGTMNSFDKNSLFALSYAFMRRFGFVHINNMPSVALHRMIDGRVQDGHLSFELSDKVKRLIAASPRELGPAIVIDILNYLKERRADEAFFESVVAYVLPQFEGLAPDAILGFYARCLSDFGDRERQLQLRKYLTEMFDLDQKAWETGQ
jgi:MoxR-like ATPase